jgi:hypothetical protein
MEDRKFNSIRELMEYVEEEANRRIAGKRSDPQVAAIL